MSTNSHSAQTKHIAHQIITESADASAAIWVKQITPSATARLRLFCFPYAGGAASIFRKWSENLAKDIEVCPIQLPGRENRIGEPLFTRLDNLVLKLVSVLRPYMDRPFAFYGHSMGTLIAFELARALRRQRLTGPMHLIVSGRCAPHVSDPAPPLHMLSDANFINGLRRYNGTREEVLNNSQLMELLVPLLRADFELCETYKYSDEPPLECPITAYAGAEELCRNLIDDWARQTTGDFESQLIPGGHFFLNTERVQFVSAISGKLCKTVGRKNGAASI